jgi:thymidylate synthase (FAD)
VNDATKKRLADLLSLYRELGGIDDAIPSSRPKKSTHLTPYLVDPGIVLLAKTESLYQGNEGLRHFLYDLDPEFEAYADEEGPHLQDGSALAKMAGQTCYLSFGPKRTMNVDSEKYFKNILSSGHGSVLEHPQYSFLIYGVSRSFTHELVRHRAGCAFSQVSQRYVDKPRFVERREYQKDMYLHQAFENHIDTCMDEYNRRAERLLQLQRSDDVEGMSKTDRRKQVNQSARECLPNETEAPIVFSANARAIRHVIGMRASKHADTQIREVFFRVFLLMALLEPDLFQDGRVEKLQDGTYGVVFDHPKV